MNYYRVHPSRNWVESQIPEIVKNVVKCLKGDDNDTDELDAEAFVQAYVNIIIGACISLGKMSFYGFIMTNNFHVYVQLFKSH